MSREKNWQIGDRVQKSDWNSGTEVITTGAITDVVTDTKTREQYSGYGYQKKTVTETYIKTISIKWDDGTESLNVTPWSAQPEDSALEREFRIKCREVDALIQEKLAIADKAIDEAIAIAEEHGIPFNASVSQLSQSYRTRSFPSKWKGVSEAFADEITDSYSDGGGYYGWVHSAVCY